MGGRGAYALRRRHGATIARTFRSGGFNRSNPTFSGGGEVSTLANGTRVSGSSDAQIKAALGSKFSREEVVRLVGAPAGSLVSISTSGNSVSASINDSRHGFSASFGLQGSGNNSATFVGSSLFSSNASKASSGVAIRTIRSGLTHGVKTGLIKKVVVPNAIGSAGSKSAQGSLLWARMGVSTNLSSISGLAARPAGLRGAKTVADLQRTKAGKTWWSENRRGFRGEIDFTKKTSASYKIARKFLGR